MTSDPQLFPIVEPFRYQRLLGMVMTGWSEGYARFELEVHDDLINRYGIPHGGVHASMLDTAMGHAGAFTGDPDTHRFVMTLSFTTNFLAAPTGRRLIAEGRRTGGGRSTYFAEGTVCDDEGTTIATATGVFRYRKGGIGGREAL